MDQQSKVTHQTDDCRLQLENQNALLRSQNRWLKRLALGSLAVAGLASFAGFARVSDAQPGANRTIVAERFVLLDAAGKKRAVIGQDAVYGLTLLDEDEKPHAVLFANKATGRGLTLYSDTLEGRKVGLAQFPNGSAALIFNDAAGKGRAVLATQADDKPVIILSDEKSKPFFSQGQQ